MNKKNKTALAISGGGAWGAWGGGTIKGLKECKGKDYDIVIGSSTGSLLSPLTAIGELEKLKEAYTSVTQKDIFDVNPFNKKGGISIWNAFCRIALTNTFNKFFKNKDKPTLGESNNLRKTITNFFSEEDFNTLKNSGKEIIASVVNLNTELAEFKSSNDYGYEDMVDWIWISANAPVFMTLVEKEGNEYIDGGIVEHIPIQEAINKGATEIDVVVHRPEVYSNKKEYKSKNIIDLFMRVIETMHKEVSKDDVAISKLIALNEDVTINLYYTPYKLSDNSLIFNKERMNDWWDLGYNSIHNGSCLKETITIKKIG